MSNMKSPVGDEARFAIDGNVISRAIEGDIRRRARLEERSQTCKRIWLTPKSEASATLCIASMRRTVAA